MRSHKGTGHLVALIHIGQGVIAAKAVAVHNSLHQSADVEEADLILEEELDCLLVGTIGGAGAQTALLDGLFAGAKLYAQKGSKIVSVSYDGKEVRVFKKDVVMMDKKEDKVYYRRMDRNQKKTMEGKALAKVSESLKSFLI